MANAEFLKQRAEEFFETAKYSIESKRYNLATFNMEQACQLYLKYYIFLKIANFSKTYSVQDLLSGLAVAYEKEAEVEEIKKKYFEEISNLEESYITARYLPAEFNKMQVEKMKLFLEELIIFLEKL